MFNFLANLVDGANASPVVLGHLLSITDQTTLLSAILNIAQNPFSNLAQVYGLAISLPQTYTPTIQSPAQLGQFSLAIKVNEAGSGVGSLNYLPGGPARLIFDSNDNVWISLECGSRN